MATRRRNTEKLNQLRRKMWRLSQYRACDNKVSALADLRVDRFTGVKGVPGLRGRIVPAAESWGDHVTLVIFEWRKVGGKLHHHSFHYHDEEEMIMPVIGEIEWVVEGKDEVVGPGDSLIIAPTALHLAKPRTECLFYSAFQPPLESIELSREDL